MISSGVTPLGGMFSSGPSCAAKGKTEKAQIAKRTADMVERNGHFITLFYRISGKVICWIGGMAIPITAATLPDPSPLSEARVRALQFCRILGCRFSRGVAVRKNGLRSRLAGP